MQLGQCTWLWQLLVPPHSSSMPTCAEQSCPAVQNRISPSWETIDAKWHIFLMLCNPLHWVNIVEVRGAAMPACALHSRSSRVKTCSATRHGQGFGLQANAAHDRNMLPLPASTLDSRGL